MKQLFLFAYCDCAIEMMGKPVSEELNAKEYFQKFPEAGSSLVRVVLTTEAWEQAAVLQDGCRALNDYITQQRVREMKEIKGRLKGRCERPGTAIHQRSKPLKTNPAFPHQPLMTTKRPQQQQPEPQRQQQQAKPKMKTTPT